MKSQKPVERARPAVALLDPLVSARIAAGEVVEQPASIVRELVDNALDAGARSLVVEIVAGGTASIRIIDDGCGMGPDDLALAILKHATSKIKTLEDLAGTTTLGFRGEALFAIAAVSRLRIVSNDGKGGHEIVVDNGRPGEVRAAAAARGTVVEVSGLFHELPARHAFLKAAASEARAVRRVLVEKMLAWPEVRFEFTVDGETVLGSAGGERAMRIADLFGAGLARELVAVEHVEDGIALGGFVLPVHCSSSSRRDQFFFLNRRPVAMPVLSRALSVGYGNQLAPGRHAIAFIDITMAPERLNVNVHPAKREVRFENESAVFTAIVHAVRQALAQGQRFAEAGRIAGGLTPDPVSGTVSRAGAGKAAPFPEAPGFEFPATPRGEFRVAGTVPVYAAGEEAPRFDGSPGGVFSGARIIGCYGANYWFYEQDDGLFVVDQHAAHERVLYERFREEYYRGGVARQGLLVPLSFVPTPAEAALLEEHGTLVAAAGFSVAPFGPRTWIIDEQPADVNDALLALRSLLAGLADPVDAARADARAERMLATLACHAAIRQGDRIPAAMLTGILASLEAVERPFSCPHGRPSIVRIRKEEIEKWFERR